MRQKSRWWMGPAMKNADALDNIPEVPPELL